MDAQDERLARFHPEPDSQPDPDDRFRITGHGRIALLAYLARLEPLRLEHVEGD